MSQDGNNLFNQQDFQSSPFDASQGIYRSDVQFAPTVPHRQQPEHLGMNFTTSPFQNQDLMMPPPQCKLFFLIYLFYLFKLIIFFLYQSRIIIQAALMRDPNQ